MPASSALSAITGAAELRVKESDRLAVMSDGLNAVGVPNELLADGIRIGGGQRLRAGTIDSHGDHRIAMSFAVASLLADEPLSVRERMSNILENVRSGHFARAWIQEHAAGLPLYTSLLEQDRTHPIEGVGKELRSRMAWLGSAEGPGHG